MSHIFNPLTGQKFAVGNQTAPTGDSTVESPKTPTSDQVTNSNKLKFVVAISGGVLVICTIFGIALIQASTTEGTVVMPNARENSRTGSAMRTKIQPADTNGKKGKNTPGTRKIHSVQPEHRSTELSREEMEDKSDQSYSFFGYFFCRGAQRSAACE